MKMQEKTYTFEVTRSELATMLEKSSNIDGTLDGICCILRNKTLPIESIDPKALQQILRSCALSAWSISDMILQIILNGERGESNELPEASDNIVHTTEQSEDS